MKTLNSVPRVVHDIACFTMKTLEGFIRVHLCSKVFPEYR